MALTHDRDTLRRDGVDVALPPAAGVCIWAGAMVGVNAAGQAVPAGTPDALAVIGIAQNAVDNRLGQSSDEQIRIRRGVYALKAAAAGITAATYGQAVQAVDDETVALLTEGAITAGVIRAVDSDGVWIEF